MRSTKIRILRRAKEALSLLKTKQLSRTLINGRLFLFIFIRMIFFDFCLYFVLDKQRDNEH